jgi:hypothetical protein
MAHLTIEDITGRVSNDEQITDDEVRTLLEEFDADPAGTIGTIEFLFNAGADLGPTTTGASIQEVLGIILAGEAERQAALDAILDIEAQFREAQEAFALETAGMTGREAASVRFEPPMPIETVEQQERAEAARADAIEAAFEALDDEIALGMARTALAEAPDKVRLAQQCVLTALLKPLSEKNSILGYSDKMLHVKDDPELLVNRLTKRPGEENFVNICPEILAELVPYVRIYKVLRKSSDGPVEQAIELSFDRGISQDSEKAELMFQDRPNRGKGVGLKSLDWTFDGSDPYTSSRSIQVNLNFFFQSFEELIRPRKASDGVSTYKYVDLILQADCRDANQEQDAEDCPKTFSNKIYSSEFYPECHEIKLVVGWSAPEGASFTSTTANGREILKYIDDMKTTLWLGLQDHNFDINQDGTFSLQANYMGRIVALTSDPRANVFIDPGPEGMSLMAKIVSLNNAIEDNKCNKTILERKKKELAATLKGQRQALVSSIITEMGRKNYLATIVIPTTSYITMINSINGGALFSSSEMANIGYTVSKTMSDDLLDLISAMESPVAPIEETVRQLGTRTGAYLDEYTEEEFLEMGGEYITRDISSETREAILAGSVYEDFHQEFVDFEYFYLGDLIEIITDRVLNPEVWALTNSKAWRGINYDKSVDKIRIVLGTLAYKFAGDDNFQTINISDIPVSLSLFLDWMKDSVVDSEREEYPFIAFINDAMTNLVSAALGSTCFEGLLGQRVKVRKTFFSSAASGDMEPFASSGGELSEGFEYTQALLDLKAEQEAALLEAEEADSFTLNATLDAAWNLAVTDASLESDESFNFKADGNPRNARIAYDSEKVASKLQQGLTSATDHYHYILFYMDNLAAGEKLTGDYDADIGNGIYHMKLGQNCGLLKSAAFKKTNQQYNREARMAQQKGESYNPLAQLSNVYDVDFTTIGNNIWIPGKRIYFDPSSISPEGFGGGSYGLGKPHELGSPAHLLGLGGYHMVTGVKSFIESGKFETVVTARWETGGGAAARRDADDETGAQCPPVIKCAEDY